MAADALSGLQKHIACRPDKIREIVIRHFRFQPTPLTTPTFVNKAHIYPACLALYTRREINTEVGMNDYKMTPGELRATWGLGTVFSLRMLGMFMVLPVLTTYGMALQGASEALIGLAIGIYGLACRLPDPLWSAL
jgi:hypothetical protein